MVCQRLFQFFDHGFRNAGLANKDDGFEVMPQAPQYFSLSFGDIHGHEYNGVAVTGGVN